MKQELERLFKIERNIEKEYLLLYEQELRGFLNSIEYNYAKVELGKLINEEKHLLTSILSNYPLVLIKKELNKMQEDNLIPLGNSKTSYASRLLNLIEIVEGDDLLDYASTLKTDINHILLTFISDILNNPYYNDIKEDLLLFKYNLIFLDCNLENEFLLETLEEGIKLESNNYRTDDLPAYVYVDKAILALESINYITDIITNQNQLELNHNKALTIISIIEVLARLILCEENTLGLIYDDLINILEDDSINPELKDILKEMFAILDNIKNSIVWAR